MTDIKERQQVSEAEYAMEMIQDSKRPFYAAGTALLGIARGYMVPDQTRDACIAIGEWLHREGAELCQPEEFKQARQDESYTPYNKGDENTYYNSVPTDMMREILDRGLANWNDDEILERLRDRMLEDMETEYTDDGLVEFAAQYGYILALDINGNWVLIPEEELK